MRKQRAARPEPVAAGLTWDEIFRTYPDRWVVVVGLRAPHATPASLHPSDVYGVFDRNPFHSPLVRDLEVAGLPVDCVWTGELRIFSEKWLLRTVRQREGHGV